MDSKSNHHQPVYSHRAEWERGSASDNLPASWSRACGEWRRPFLETGIYDDFRALSRYVVRHMQHRGSAGCRMCSDHSIFSRTRRLMVHREGMINHALHSDSHTHIFFTILK